jgi:hypothetical protein
LEYNIEGSSWRKLCLGYRLKILYGIKGNKLKEEDFLGQAQREILKDSRKRDKKVAFPVYQH